MSSTAARADEASSGASASSTDLPAEGPAAPPRSNGELVFEEPWEGRVFGVTLALVDSGAISWSEFQSELVAEIRSWEAAHSEIALPEGASYRYYERWLAAFESLLDRKGLCSETLREGRVQELAKRPHGHDH